MLTVNHNSINSKESGVGPEGGTGSLRDGAEAQSALSERVAAERGTADGWESEESEGSEKAKKERERAAEELVLSGPVAASLVHCAVSLCAGPVACAVGS
jgi:hypothetical protein